MIFIKKIRLVKNYKLELNIESVGNHKTQISRISGSKTDPSTVYATIFASDRIVEINLLEELSIDLNEWKKYLDKYLIVSNGQILSKGQIIAHRQTFGYERLIKAEFDCIVNLNLKTAKLNMYSIPDKYDLEAGVYGDIEYIDNKRVVLKSNFLLCDLIYTKGQNKFGKLKILDKNSNIDLSWKDCIIYSIEPISIDTINILEKHFVKCVIGSYASPNIANYKGPCSIGIIDGFGNYLNNFYKKIEYSKDLLIYLNVQEKKIYIGTTLNYEDKKFISTDILKIGNKVQIFNDNYFSYIGEIVNIDKDSVNVNIECISNEIKINKCNLNGIII